VAHPLQLHRKGWIIRAEPALSEAEWAGTAPAVSAPPPLPTTVTTLNRVILSEAKNLLLFLFVIPSEAEGPAFLPPLTW
jgi:hypothetical protein